MRGVELTSRDLVMKFQSTKNIKKIPKLFREESGEESHM